MAGTWTNEVREAYAAMGRLGFKRGEFSAKQEYTAYGEYAGVRISYNGTTKDMMTRTGLATNPTKALDAGLSLCLFYDADKMRIAHVLFSLSSQNRGGVGRIEVLRVRQGESDRLFTWVEKRDGFLKEVTPKSECFGYRV